MSFIDPVNAGASEGTFIFILIREFKYAKPFVNKDHVHVNVILLH